MLYIDDLLWVIPGFILVSYYNKFTPYEKAGFSDWSYVFLLVLLGAVTWLPSELITIEIINWLDLDMNKDLNKWQYKIPTLILSLGFTVMWIWLSKKEFLSEILPEINDIFYNKCIKWEGQNVLLTLKNEKYYMGILWKYSDTRTKHENQTISIVPIKSGYRHKETKQVYWTEDYIKITNAKPKSMGDQETNILDSIVITELIIPRSQIVSFTKWTYEAFDHFSKPPTNTHSDTQ